MQVQAGTGLYFVFLATVFFLYWGCAGSRLARLTIILAANFLFLARYGLFYIFLIPACATIDYLVGLGLMRFQGRAPRRVLVSLSIAVNLSLLVGSRHMGWFLSPGWDWVFPLGLSFYTFQALTYTIDLYRRDAEGTGSLLAHLSAVSFFPTLQAGPITRVAELVKQFAKPPALDRSTGGRAFFLIALGLLKKTLIADFLADNLVNRVFDTPNLYSGGQALLAVYAFSLQLYFDFSGYTDIARGAGLLVGVELPRNFDRPYLSANIAEFWRRWHISFSNWLRDYLYFSLPGKRTKVDALRRPGDHHAAGRPVARRHLDLRHLGTAARRRAGARSLAAGAPAPTAPRGHSRAASAAIWPSSPPTSSCASPGSFSAPAAWRRPGRSCSGSAR